MWIDPLDGTQEFIQGIFNDVTILVGISVRGVPIAGIIHHPFVSTKGHSIWGIVGGTCHGIVDTSSQVS